jgi:hypothetical protein
MIKLVAIAWLIVGAGAANAAIVLYDAGLGTLPGSQGWLSVVGGSATHSNTGGLLTLNTMAAQANQAGYSSEVPLDGSLQLPSMPTLNRENGFRLQFQLRVVEESHTFRDDNGDGLSDRAGFSLLMITEDLLGLELGFFTDRVWAYAAAGEGSNSLFTQAEGADFDTSAALTDYELSVAGSNYSLLANGSQLLSGTLRNYNPSGVPAALNPYDNPSFLSFGDNTTSAASQVQVGQISFVPEPSSAFILLSVGLLAIKTRRNRLGTWPDSCRCD